MMAATSPSFIPESCAPMYCLGTQAPRRGGSRSRTRSARCPPPATTRCMFSSGNERTMKWSWGTSRGAAVRALPHFGPLPIVVRVVELAQDCTAARRALARARSTLQGRGSGRRGRGCNIRCRQRVSIAGTVAPVEHPLHPSKSRTPRRGLRSNRRRTLRSRSAPGASRTRTPASLMRAHTGSNIGIGDGASAAGALSRPPCAWPGRNSTIGVPSSMTRSLRRPQGRRKRSAAAPRRSCAG